MQNTTILYEEAYNATKELINEAKLEKEDILVVGCSTSEIFGSQIGSDSKPELAESVFKGIYQAVNEHEIYLASQCCEHLNRALIIEKKVAKQYGYDIVNVVPQPKAGGSFATMTYKYMEHPVAVEHIKADAGMDIGDTLIGMHLKDVAVPLRLSVSTIGQAHLVCARVRPKFIGGIRANYNEDLL